MLEERKELKDPKRPPTSSMTFGTFGSTHESTSTRDRLLLRYRIARALALSRLEVAEVVRPKKSKAFLGGDGISSNRSSGVGA